MMTNECIATGEWSILNGKSYPGTLTDYKEQGFFQLEIYSDEYFDGSPVSNFKTGNPFNNNFPRNVDVINGFENGFVSITLLNSHWAGTAPIGTNLYSIKYKSDYVLGGGSLTLNGRLRVLQATFELSNLGSWYNGWQSDIPYDIELPVFGEEMNLQEIQINDELSLKFFKVAVKSWTRFPNDYSIEFKDFLELKYSKDIPFDQALKDIAKFRQLLEFSFGKPCNVSLSSLIVPINNTTIRPIVTKPSPICRFSVQNYTLSKNKIIEKDTIHQNTMLISNWKISKIELNDIIKHWFNSEYLKNVQTYYTDSNNWFQGSKDAILSFVMVNNRLLNLIQGLEDFYRVEIESVSIKLDRATFNKRKADVLKLLNANPQLKQWLNDTFKFTKHPSLKLKLESVINYCNEHTPNLLQEVQWEKYLKIASKLRNELSHGINETYKVNDEFRLAYFGSRLILILCIMRSLKINYIEHLLLHNTTVHDILNEIKLAQATII